MKRRAILHIGVPKTGSTSIQAWLVAQRAALAARGVHVPDIVDGRRTLLKRLGTGGPRDPAATLTAELLALDPALHSVVLSNENLATATRNVAAVRAALDPWAESFLVVLYLRRQDEQRVSQFSQALRRARAVREGPFDLPPLDYAAILAAWGAAFGDSALRPRVFAADTLVGGDVVADFATLLDAAALAPAERTARNPSLGAAAQLVLARIAKASGIPAPALLQLPIWRRLLLFCETRFPGPGLLPPRAEAVAYMAACAAANETVRAAWFPDRSALFDMDFGRYPAAASPPDAAALTEIAIAVAAELIAGKGEGRDVADRPAPPEDGVAAVEAKRDRRRRRRAERAA